MFITTLFLLTLPWLATVDNEKPDGDNIARGRLYTLDPKPNYPLCTDPGDATQLTDGQYSNANSGFMFLSGPLWTQISTVGWRDTPLAQITIDLGRVAPIAGVSFNTAAGAADVDWPAAIHVLVSDDNRAFHHAGELTGLSAASGSSTTDGYKTHRFRIEKLATHGRFVKLLVIASGPYIFVDEVEVYRGVDAILSNPLPGTPIIDPIVFIRQWQVKSAITRRIASDAQAIRAALSDAQLPAGERQRLESELADAATNASTLPDSDLDSFRAVLPLNEPHARLFRVQAAVWRASGIPPVLVWQSPLWDPLDVTAPLPRTPVPARIEMKLTRSEFRAGAFNVSNATDHDLTLRLRFEQLPTMTKPPWVTVHEVAWTDTKLGLPVAGALPEAKRDGEDFLINTPSGMTRQVWLTFHPANFKPGSHPGQMVVSGAGLKNIVVPLRLQISPVPFPTQPMLQLGGWDYTDVERIYGITRENRSALTTLLREYFVDTPWATSGVMPAVPDFGRLDNWLQRWPSARNYRVFLNVGSSFAGTQMGTQEFEQKVGIWISAYVAHIRQRGLKASQLGVLLVDEPSKPEQNEIIVAWARAIRAAEPEVLIWEDPNYKDPAVAATMLAACDVLCINRPVFLAGGQAIRNAYARQRAAGRILNFYSSSGPVSSLDPYAYHRLQAWTSWQQGATAEFFWAFGDNGGGSTWNEYSTPGTNSTPLFLDDRTVTPAKHMEAIREGVEDYEYLVMLRDRIGQLERAGESSSQLKTAKNLLETAADRVLNAPGAETLGWAEPKDRTVADSVRLEILDALEALQPKGDE